MRVLSSTEVKELKGIEDVPIELRHCYFPVALRAYVDRPLDKSHIHKDQILSVLEHTRSSLDIIVLRSDPSIYRDWREISKTTLSEFEFGKQSETRSFISAYGLFPTSHLISHEQLQSLKVSIQPGFIYLGVSIEFNDDSRGIDDGSIYLNEPSYYNAIAIPTREIQRKLVIKRFSRITNTDQDIEKEEPEFESSWRGRVADIEQLTNSREVYHGKQRVSTLAQGKIVRDYILETPLELPPGYVMDTLFKLQKRRAEIPRLAKKVSQIIFDSSNIKRDSHALTTITFPQGEPEMRGIEGNWRFGEDAWLMQSILMARLIGGAFWRYTLQTLEQEMVSTRSG